MQIELKMPALSPTMEKGTIAKWLVKVGDRVQPGDILAEIETDKATMEYEAVDEGVIRALVIAEGTDDVPVGAIIATIGEGDEAAAAAPVVEAPPRAPAPAHVEATMPTAIAAAPSPAPFAPRARLADKLKASPLAARIAEARGIDLAAVTGTGPNGRIVKADLGLAPPLVPLVPVLASVESAVQPAVAPPPDAPHEAVKPSTMRRTIARRLTEAKQSVPHFYLTARVPLDALLALRAELNASLADRGEKISVNDMLVKALALALHEVPDAHVQYGGDTLYRFSRADIAMAVAIDGGLVTPVIRDAGALSLTGIAKASRELAARARDGTLAPESWRGGTASISNLGMYGIDAIVPVINPPQALILGVGAGIEQPWKVDGAIALATVADLTASFDHRAIDGAIAAQFMAALRDLVEHPMRIVS